MPVAVALWSIELQPGTPETITLPNDLRITNVALGAEVKEGRTSVKLTYKAPIPEEDEDEEDEDEEEQETTTTVLCSLTPGKIEHALIDLILEQDYEVTFEAVGKNTVHLTGNFVDQMPPHDHGDDYSDLSDGDEDDELMADIGSESDELEEEDDSHRFEEIIEEVKEEIEQTEEPEKKEHSQKKDSKKRPRESDTIDGEETKLSKAQKKKLNKKLKAENGEAVPSGEAKESEQPKEKEQKESKKEKPKFQELAGGLKIQDHKAGTGRQAKAGDHVSMRYVGKLQNGKIFDKNTSGKPFKFHLGKGEVIKGWDVGVAGMQVGGERLLIIPPAMAYGKQRTGDIPPNSTLTFEVKLVGIN